MNYEEQGRKLDEQRQSWEDSDWRSDVPRQWLAQKRMEENRANKHADNQPGQLQSADNEPAIQKPARENC